MKRLLLDTDVIIGFERGSLHPNRVFTADDDVALSVITASELFQGVAAASRKHHARRAAQVETALDALVVENLTVAVARIHAVLAYEARRQGIKRGKNDLLIAATAVATKRTLITTDQKARFDLLPTVDVRVV